MTNVSLPRELIKWLQSLDLTWSAKVPKWDLSNGYLVAEIISWYYPRDIEMHMYHNALSLNQKLCNWHLLRKVLQKTNVDVSDELIDATMHCKPDAAALLLQTLYEQLTNRRLKTVSTSTRTMDELDFTDHAYQATLPLHCRSTALQAVRNNFRITELMTHHDIIENQLKAQSIIDRHSNDRARQRLEDPMRFNHQLTVGERAPRRPPPPQTGSSRSQPQEFDDQQEDDEGDEGSEKAGKTTETKEELEWANLKQGEARRLNQRAPPVVNRMSKDNPERSVTCPCDTSDDPYNAYDEPVQKKELPQSIVSTLPIGRENAGCCY